MVEAKPVIDKEKPFNLAWLDSSYFETLFPGTPWQNINDMLSLDLAQAVRQQFNNPHRKQMIIELLGSQFKRSYLADEKDSPNILYPPLMNDDQRKKLENEAKSWLQIQINEIALRKGCALKSDQNDDYLSNEMKDYLEHTYNIVSTSLDRDLYVKQTKAVKIINDIKNDTKIKLNDKEKDSIASAMNEYKGKNNLREILKYQRNLTFLGGKFENSKFRENLTNEYSEIIADSLLTLLQKDPRRIAFVLHKLIGQQLTVNLRKFIWSDILLRHERKKIDINITIDIDLLVRKNFANGVTRGKNELKLSDPTQTPVTGLIENAVIETYSRVYSLNEYLNEPHLRQTMKILNVLYTYSRDYEPYYIYWLLPFQLTFNNEKSKNELIYDLAMYLDLYVKNLFPQWSEIFIIASKIMQDLYTNDSIFYDHLKKISKINPRVNTKDFVSQIISNEGKKTINPLVSNSNDDFNLGKENKELLSEPQIFIRKWIGESFSGILRKNSLLYVWDQLFMSLWASHDFEIIAKSLLYLLKNQFMMARDHEEMRRVFLDEPCKLYTADIQSAFMHLSSGRKENEVAYLNRRDKDMVLNNTGYYARPNDLTRPRKTILDPIGIKDINLRLVIPKLGSTADFDPSRLCVDAILYYGSKKLLQKQTQSVPLVKDIVSSLQDTKTYDISILNDKLVFNVSEFDQESNPTQRDIYTIIYVKYNNVSLTEFYLGFCKFSLYSAQKVGQISTWDITMGKVSKLLHPMTSGHQTQNLEFLSDIPNASYKDRVGPGSTISFTVFDAKSEGYLIG